MNNLICGIPLLVILFFSSSVESLTAKDYKGFTEQYSIENGYQSVGENINPINGQLSYESIDMHIPGGNGMDILISRSFGQSERVWGFNGQIGSMSNWRLEIPRIIIPTVPYGITRGWSATPDKAEYDKLIDHVSTTRTGICNDPYPGDGRASTLNSGGIQIAKKYWSGMTLKIPGQSAQQLFKNTDDARYPSAKWVTTNDWIATCTSDGNGFVVKSPKGLTYRIDVVQAIYSHIGLSHQFNHTGNTTLFASEVNNIFGTAITYDYESHGNFFMPKNDIGHNASHIRVPYIEQRLTKINRSDGTNIDVNYFSSTPSRYNERIKNIAVDGGQSIEYGYYDNPMDGRYYLSEVTSGEKVWRYKYGEVSLDDKKSYRDEGNPHYFEYNGPRLLTMVTLPSGGTISYSYKVFNRMRNDPYRENRKLHSKVVNDGVDNTNTWFFDYKDSSLNSKNVVQFTATRDLDTSIKYFSDDKSFQHGKLLREVVTNYDSENEDSITKEINYTYELIADIGEFTFLDFPEDIAKSLTSKVRLKGRIISQDGGIYSTSFESDDLYGKPTKIEESFSGKTKFTLLSYQHETGDNWLLGLPTSVMVSEDDSENSYQTISEITYHDDVTAKGQYDGLGLPFEKKQFGRWVNRYPEYDSEGNIIKEEYNAVNDQGNRFVLFSDYKFGIAKTIRKIARYGDDHITMSKELDANGWEIGTTDLNGNQTSFSYHSSGAIQAVSYSNDEKFGNDWYGKFFTWDYSDGTSPKRIVKYCNLDLELSSCESEPVYSVTEIFDGLMRLKQLVQTDGTDTRYKNFNYDYNNQKIFESFWSSSKINLNGIETIYDGFGRIKEVSTSGLGQVTYAYLAGNRIQVTDAKGNATTTSFQAFGSPNYDVITRIESPENVTTTIDVDVYGHVNSISQNGYTSDANLKTFHENRYYDDYKQLCLVTREDVGNVLYKHNALGELVWSKPGVDDTECRISEPENSTTFSYDGHGELHKIDYPDNSGDVIYELDNNGNILTLEAGSVVHRYEYNNQNLLEEEQLFVEDESPLMLDYKYNDLQQLEHLGYPDGTIVNYQPNSFGEPTEAQSYDGGTVALSFAKSATYYANGLLKSFTYGNGIKHETTIHTDSLLPKRLKDTGAGGSNLPSTVMSLTYDYDNNANVTSIIDDQNPKYSLTNLEYDGLDRLTSTTGGSEIGSSEMHYDGFGNITYYKSKNKTLTYEYDYAKNRLFKVNGVNGQYGSIGYDDRGNINDNGAYTLDFNHANQLTTAKGNSYLYDGHNRRVKQTDINGTSYSMYSQGGTLLYREKGDTITGEGTNYIYLGKKLIAKYGDVTSQSIDESRQHARPFGETIEAPKDDVGYTGHKFDTDLGLSYMQARYYDPVIGRFYSNDPVGFRDVHSFNRYAYANNNPYKYTDPSGAIAESVWDAASLSVGLTSLGGNLWNGNWGAAGIDALGVIADGAALAIPVVPGGAGIAIKASREASEALATRGNSAQYSVSFETKLSNNMYPGKSDKAHFQEANQNLHQQMQSDPVFGNMMEALHPGITKGVQPGARGAYPRKAPTKNVTWHHGVEPGVMQLVPRSHHNAPGAVQSTLHPGGVGGMSTWGGGRN
ncbi:MULTISPECIES: RHS repeat-associated core domain-containing protein [unclassified Pseudoalteromonas]|uniref:RHS repeat-associated core domain-containing protein n=1 Tax=unclassified Pseudoalteromonas TaxID=194690 RepID=UPI001109D2EF|nr:MULTISPECIES: RHS repeat-associated core domain-containing protein [unclassified Pseudoalteromonas]TMN80632.1 hypothetical protein CWB64_13235 [Pseudoalteromonas sp. S410]TMN89781.1 hypothetical protein CWB62_12095 [Pseudoalteromonas sp. S408]TMN97392.1 hypothetical protein CWB61_10235 [Pseudoalteromonas sp. S407]TMO02401.1 hypothetical protein CWB63_01710 [Pseudoalteromonas sp. S409]TMO11886.1 hypothetical protein CWB57_04335 [Pseudoalteromonas sp. S186]